MKKKIILRFLNNKAIEIGTFLFKAIVLIIYALGIFAIGIAVFYGIGRVLYSFDITRIWFIGEMDFDTIWRHGECIGAGFLTLLMLVVGAFGLFLAIGFGYWVIVEPRDWIKENWQRATREIKEESNEQTKKLD